MESDAQQMDEVVVVAYGVRKKGTVTGSMSVVKAEQMENVPTPSFDQALQGTTPGLQVISSSGEPSATANFQIRGTNSINAGTTPLFILDGIAITDEVFSSINPNDIESISGFERCFIHFYLWSACCQWGSGNHYKRGRSGDNGQITVRALIWCFQTSVWKVGYDEYDRASEF